MHAAPYSNPNIKQIQQGWQMKNEVIMRSRSSRPKLIKLQFQSSSRNQQDTLAGITALLNVTRKR